MYHKGKITERTIYDPNEYILHDDYAECITYDKEGNETARIKVDLDKVEELKQFKIYIRKQGGDTWYAAISINGKKVLLHRYLMGMHEEEYSIKKVVDNYKGMHLGYFDTEQEAIIARLTKEFELCGDYGPNKDLYHLLGHCSKAGEQA